MILSKVDKPISAHPTIQTGVSRPIKSVILSDSLTLQYGVEFGSDAMVAQGKRGLRYSLPITSGY